MTAAVDPISLNIDLARSYEYIKYAQIKNRDEISEVTNSNFRVISDRFPSNYSQTEMINLLLSGFKQEGLEETCHSDLDEENTQLSAKSTHLGITVLQVWLASSIDYNLSGDDDNTNVRMIVITVFGIEERVLEYTRILKINREKDKSESKSALIRWMFDSGNGGSARTFGITKDWEIDDSFYPQFSKPLNEYYRSYSNSSAPILILYGEPGTGKTTFIRDMICELGLNSTISFDLKILCADSTFVSHLTDPHFDAIIIEDADELLSSARGDYNKVIAKILNISDGIIKLPKKKMIFTTNLRRVDDIDSAITRPGRCFDVVEFRKLNRNEIKAVGDYLEKDLDDLIANSNEGQANLSEIFSFIGTDVSANPLETDRRFKLENKTRMGF